MASGHRVLQTRKSICLASAALSMASICSFFGAQIWYSSTRPTEPHPEQGRIYAHHLKLCATVYLTASEATGLTILPIAFLGGLLSAGINYPRERNSLGVAVEFTATKREFRVYWIAMFSYILIIVFVGPS